MQTKPLRSFGIDVTQTSMQPILDELGIERSVKQLSQAEKEILRYIATLRQGQVAMGDFANTVESPANQLKVLKQQLIEAKIAFTNLFIGAFANILPYVNAILMVIKEVSKAIADMFGIKMTDYNSGIASQEDAYLDLGDSVDGATKKVKELKRQTLGFDEIHNINENKDTGSSGASSVVSGGIDKKLLDAIKGYDNGMEKVKMKATEIRDRIMEWLGFTKKIDPLTGNTYFKYEGIDKTLSNMWKSFKGLSTEGKILVGLGLVTGATKLWNIGKKLVSTFGNSGLGKVLKIAISPFGSLLSNMKSLTQYTRVYTSITGNLKDGILGGVEAWRQQNIIVKNSKGEMDKFKTAMNGAKTAITGLITGAVGLYTVHESMKNLSTEGANLVNILGLVGGGFTAIASGIQIGSIFGQWGAIIGGLAGAMITLSTALAGYQDETEKIIAKSKASREEANEYLESLDEQNKSIEENLISNLALTESHKMLIDELKTLVDENGNVKKGYEERAEFILTTLKNAYGTEYNLINGHISKYNELISSIENVIKTKEAEILLNANEEKYSFALQQQTKLWSQKESSQKRLNQLLSEEQRLKDIIEKIVPNGDIRKMKVDDLHLYNETVKSLEALELEIQKEEETFDTASKKYTENIQTITTYSNLQKAILTGDMEKIEQAAKQYTNSYVQNNEIIQLSLADRIKKDYETAKIMIDNAQNLSDEEKQIVQNSADSMIQTTIDELTSISKNVSNLTPEIINAWGYLSQQSESKFMENFSKLDSDIQQEIISKMYSNGYEISSELQEGLNEINPTLKIDADSSLAVSKIDSLLSQLKSASNSNNIFKAFGIDFSSAFKKKADGGVYSNGSWKNIQQYANGGAPSHGTLFWAGEHGAEVVAHANGRTEVLNQSQMASVMYSAVVSGMAQVMSQYGGGVAEINVHASKDVIVETAINGINQATKQTGNCPINIPVN